jgi:GT2 family glycosyltransferase
VRLRPTESGTPVDQSGPDVTPLPAVVPPVVVVMVTHDPGPWFEDTLASIAAQTYADLGVVVVDTASEVDPSDRVRDQLPDARIHVLEHDPGYGAAANTATGLVEGAAFYLFLHDDVALEPDSVRALVEEAFRSNAGVIGPKLVDWHDPTRLLQVGLGADKTGVLAPYAEVGELDQEQHDAVRDVFAVPGACTLVRTDLFEALHGFDEAIDYLGEDLDLCWRAHTLGARVMVAPGARVRHLEAMGERIPIDDRRRRLARHRLRTTLVSYGWWSRLKVLPQAIIWALVEALYGVLSGHPAQARDVLSAWPWNLRRYKTARARRKLLKVARGVKDSDVREFQVNGSARFNALVRGQLLRRDDRVTTFTRSSRDMIGSLQAGSRQFTGAFALVLGVLLAVSSRELLIDPIPAIGELARFPSAPGDLIASWWSGWSRDGLGGAAGQPTAHLLLGLASFVMFGATGLLRTVLIVGMVPLGALGAWRLARPIGSARASVAAFAVYLAIPVPYNALARGSWSGLVAYAAAPWVMLMLGRASGVAPFGPVSLDGDDAESIPAGTQGEPSRGAEVGVDGRAGLPATRRRMGGLILGLGLLLALTAAIVPSFVVIAAAMGLALALGSVLCFRVAGVARMLAVTGGAVIVAVALHVPWSLELISAPSWWEAVAGVGSTNGGPLTLGRVIRFESGPWGAPPLGWAFLAAGVLPVIIGRSWRLEWAVRAWFVALAAWGVLWAGQAGHLPFGLPAAEVVLAPAAAALALTAALGIASFDTDLRAYTFGWRQVLSVVAALGVVLGALPLGAGLIDGRWRMPARGFGASLDPLVSNHDRPAARVLWIGDPELLPVSVRTWPMPPPTAAYPRCWTGSRAPRRGPHRCWPRLSPLPKMAAPIASVTCWPRWVSATSWSPVGWLRPAPPSPGNAIHPEPSRPCWPSSSTSRRSRWPTACSSIATPRLRVPDRCCPNATATAPGSPTPYLTSCPVPIRLWKKKVAPWVQRGRSLHQETSWSLRAPTRTGSSGLTGSLWPVAATTGGRTCSRPTAPGKPRSPIRRRSSTTWFRPARSPCGSRFWWLGAASGAASEQRNL